MHEIFDEAWNVLTALGQGRHANRHHRQAMVEIFAELAGGDLSFDVAAGRRNDAHVDLHFLSAADALERLLDQDPQDLVLGLARHVGDLVDEQRAAMRLLESTDFAPSSVRRLLHAEQLDLHPLRHHCRRIDHDEGTVGAG